MSKKNLFILALQVVIIGVFALIATGSGTDGAATRSAARGFGQGLYCGSNGFIMVGTASSSSACESICDNKGYSAYCYGDEGGCFCK